MTNFLEEAKSHFPYTQTLRRDFHTHPELGFKEIRTGGIVAKELEALGIEVTKGVGKTGVVGCSKGQNLDPPCYCALTWMLFRSSKIQARNMHHKIKV